MTAAQAADGPDAVASQQPRPEVNGRLHAHTVEYQPRAAP
jgi:hypothetical protein